MTETETNAGGLGPLHKIPNAAKQLDCSTDHVLGLIEDGEIEYIDIARSGSKHREIRLAQEHIDNFKHKRTRKEYSKAAPASPTPRRKIKVKGENTPKAKHSATGTSHVDAFRAKWKV